jgi:hypothetical protein
MVTIKEVEIKINKAEELEEKIKNLLNIDDIKDVEITEGFKSIFIRITPKSAWHDALEVKVNQDRTFSFRTSSGGWEDEQQALFEIASISNYLVTIIDELKKISLDLLALYKEIKKDMLNLRKENEN